jgi:hypothetical protein
VTVAKSDSFGALSFWASADGYGDSSEADVAVEHIPWSDYTIVDLGGKGLEEMTFLALVDGDPRTTLRSVEGTQATLTCPAYTGTAVLKSWSIEEWHATTNERTIKLTFILVP